MIIQKNFKICSMWNKNYLIRIKYKNLINYI